MQIMMNAMGVHGKRSSLERSLDKLIFCIFGLLAVVCIIDAVGSSRWVNKVSSFDKTGLQSIAAAKE
jgi:hydroxylamine reductase (hybrid-cluster protein)